MGSYVIFFVMKGNENARTKFLKTRSKGPNYYHNKDEHAQLYDNTTVYATKSKKVDAQGSISFVHHILFSLGRSEMQNGAGTLQNPKHYLWLWEVKMRNAK